MLKLKLKISETQKKIAIVAFGAIAILLVFLFFIYLPGKNRVKLTQTNLLNIENQIKEIEEDKSLRVGREFLQKQIADLDNKFPSKEEQSLKAIADIARKLNIEIDSITPQPKKIFIEKDNQEIKIEGKALQIISINLQMRCSYKDLVQYIEALNRDLVALITIEGLKISKGAPEEVKLNIELRFNLYLSS